MKIKLFEEFTKSLVYRGIRNDGQINYIYNGVDDSMMGIFYTDKKLMAEWFAGITEFSPNKERYIKLPNSNGHIITTTIELENPYIIESVDEDYDSFQQYMDILDEKGVENFKNELIINNHDGIILKNCNTNYYIDNDTYNIYIVF